MMPEHGRFTSPDPLKQGINHYVYALNNPTTNVDPTGLFSWGSVFDSVMGWITGGSGNSSSGSSSGGNNNNSGSVFDSINEWVNNNFNQNNNKNYNIPSASKQGQLEIDIVEQKDKSFVPKFQFNQPKIAGHPLTQNYIIKNYIYKKYGHQMEYDDISLEIQISRDLRTSILTDLLNNMGDENINLAELANENPFAIQAINASMGRKAHYGYNLEQTIVGLENMRTVLGLEDTGNYLSKSDVLGLLAIDESREDFYNSLPFGNSLQKRDALHTRYDQDVAFLGFSIALAGYMQSLAVPNEHQMMVEVQKNKASKKGGKYGTTPEGRPLTKHYATETGPKRNIPGSVVDDVINNNSGKVIDGGKTVYYDAENNITVITGDGGSIVSVHKGSPRKGQY